MFPSCYSFIRRGLSKFLAIADLLCALVVDFFWREEMAILLVLRTQYNIIKEIEKT